MMSILVAVLLASLFGSLHCAGMCGALVAFAVGATETQSAAARAALHAAYHGGRMVTYALVGAACGLLGAALDLGGAMLGLNRVAAVLAGGMMIAVGVVAIVRYAGVRVPHPPVPNALRRTLAVGQRAAMGLRPLPRALTIGLLTAFLPCGWLYAFAIIAAGTGTAVMGAAVMVAFWMGTVPVLVWLGVGVQALTGTLGRRIPLATAIAVVLLGLHTVIGRSGTPVAAFESTVQSLRGSDTMQQVEAVQHTTPACCQNHSD
jgi:sulfite exporter TauE/SafE